MQIGYWKTMIGWAKMTVKNCEGEMCVSPKHPAKFTDILIETIAKHISEGDRVLDPFAGTGKIGMLKSYVPNLIIGANELEPEWLTPNEYGCDYLYYQDAEFLNPLENYNVIITSPTYGNRMADNFKASNPQGRITYTHYLGRTLTDGNTGKMHFGKKYQDKHVACFKNLLHLLPKSGKVIINISDFIKQGQIIQVVDWYVEMMESLGMELIDDIPVHTPRMRYGANNNVRVEEEHILIFRFEEKRDCGIPQYI